MKRFASTLSENRPSQNAVGRAQWNVGSIEGDGIRYGFTTQALIASTIATATTIVTSQSTTIRTGRGNHPVTRSSGWCRSCLGSVASQEKGGAGGGTGFGASGTSSIGRARG